MTENENILNAMSFVENADVLVAMRDLKYAVKELEGFALTSLATNQKDIVREVEIAQKIRNAVDAFTVVYIGSIEKWSATNQLLHPGAGKK